ncbi:hypothetical protein Pme01_10480 [Planosporangium mesophilum]|uniref:Uncharacterized protein n=2 Tax=Planosporangium mesophilum TaxID=689768 RepID=A0A8J3T9C4_9ACTN|nr:hypothetical protein Pme01_10480 [Planosporangium mesophilum]
MLPVRRVGSAGARELAASASLDDALRGLAGSPYGRNAPPDSSLAAAQRGVAATLLDSLRVLARWVPADGVALLRLLAGWFELVNIDDRVRVLTRPGAPQQPPLRLGVLATAWPRLAGAGSLPELRAVLAGSPWGDPGGDGPYELSLCLRLRWAERVAAEVPPARPWAAGAVALLAARDRMVRQACLPEPAARSVGHLLGGRWCGTASPAHLSDLAPAAAWVLAGVRDPADLRQAEARWWARLRTDGARLLASPGFGPRPVIGAAALLAVDARLVHTALQVAAGTGRRAGVLAQDDPPIRPVWGPAGSTAAEVLYELA